ncbi:hypothetical protein [Burkholderia vietnamiensis]|uniref:hypothetical protein n=1 Tax=Burkholderia vietnamiensis TaxID=60552 RepID=UPI001BA2AF93|nr:hypothetical protein [Burkholderia vietnamiensis]MBR8206790.1 hypothetical protein [Burkholderia vietnamiensis]MCA8395590.1 hypothetical protein [Burkholderia vietnamiensis]HDR8962071.1 hypothetical protein [Burkholderia vietnamiensis]HDR9247813.1 hypothetical protein [Burkholderia vietnamiensis]
MKEPALHREIPPGSVPLGPFNGYDLQLAFAPQLSPTLLARYGKEDHAYEAFSPDTGKSIDEESPALREAFHRARALGWGDELKAR